MNAGSQVNKGRSSACNGNGGVSAGYLFVCEVREVRIAASPLDQVTTKTLKHIIVSKYPMSS